MMPLLLCALSLVILPHFSCPCTICNTCSHSCTLLLVVSDPPPFTDLASAIEWTQGLRSLALAAAQACMQQSAYALASSNGECELSSTAAHLASENEPDFTCTHDQAKVHSSLVDSMHVHFSRHAAILDPLSLSLKRLNALPSPALLQSLLPLVHALTQAAQAFSHSIVVYHSLLLALAARSGPVSSLSPSPANDPVLLALGGQGPLAPACSAEGGQ